MKLTPRQADVMSHALAYPKCYRNNFHATPGTPNDETWLELVELGYAKFINRLANHHNLYVVTELGIEVLTLYRDYGPRKVTV